MFEWTEEDRYMVMVRKLFTMLSHLQRLFTIKGGKMMNMHSYFERMWKDVSFRAVLPYVSGRTKEDHKNSG
jgi:hypothetical protein